MESKKDRLALVTGARKGLGKALALHFLEQGYTVIGASRHATEWEADGFLDFPTDVSNEESVVQLTRRIHKLDGTLSLVINNAAVASMNAAILTPASSFRRMLDVNTTGTFLVARETAKLMRKTGGGHILNLSSVAVPLLLEGQAAYASSKSAVETLTQILAKEFSDYSIGVNTLRLPPLTTDMTKGVPKEKLQKILETLSLKSMPSLEEVCRAISTLVSNPPRSLTAKIFTLEDCVSMDHE